MHREKDIYSIREDDEEEAIEKIKIFEQIITVEMKIEECNKLNNEKLFNLTKLVR